MRSADPAVQVQPSPSWRSCPTRWLGYSTPNPGASGEAEPVRSHAVLVQLWSSAARALLIRICCRFGPALASCLPSLVSSAMRIRLPGRANRMRLAGSVMPVPGEHQCRGRADNAGAEDGDLLPHRRRCPREAGADTVCSRCLPQSCCLPDGGEIIVRSETGKCGFRLHAITAVYVWLRFVSSVRRNCRMKGRAGASCASSSPAKRTVTQPSR